MGTMTIYWVVFIAIFLAVFVVDIYVNDNSKNNVTVKSSLIWTVIWISIAIGFGFSLFLFFPQNPESIGSTAHTMGIKFIAGYLTEYSLSIDNLFVFIMIFSLMKVSARNQPKLLHLGIMLSIVLRILFILVGMELVQQFHWIIYVFGAILLWTAYKMSFTAEDGHIDPKNNFMYKIASKLFPVCEDQHSPHFFVRRKGKLYITMMFLVFLVIGSTDVLFAVDSIPAIIGVIKEGSGGILSVEEERFLAITSNVFAVMGLISLFFALKGIISMFRYLKYGVSFILFFIGLKMILSFSHTIESFFESHSWISLIFIISTLALSVVLSVIIADKENIEQTKGLTRRDSLK